jgi:hypothetical protein
MRIISRIRLLSGARDPGKTEGRRTVGSSRRDSRRLP